MKRITILAAAGVLVATPAIGAWAAFGATDDNPSHASNVARRRRHGAEPTRPRRRRAGGDDHGRHHRHHGADDAVGHPRHGADDPAGHGGTGRAGAR